MFFFFNDTATTEIYTLSLHDALPICIPKRLRPGQGRHGSDPHEDLQQQKGLLLGCSGKGAEPDRKSTRLNSSHSQISYAVFCFKKKTEPGLSCAALLTMHRHRRSHEN